MPKAYTHSHCHILLLLVVHICLLMLVCRLLENSGSVFIQSFSLLCLVQHLHLAIVFWLMFIFNESLLLAMTKAKGPALRTTWSFRKHFWKADCSLLDKWSRRLKTYHIQTFFLSLS
jgi:hypothetical protein